MGTYDFTCANCGKTRAGTSGDGPLSAPQKPTGWVWNKLWGFGRKAFCSNRCLDEYKSRN